MLLKLTSRVERKVAGSTVILTFEDNWSVWIINQFASSKYLLVKLTWRRPVLRKFVSLLWRERGCSGDNCFWLYFSFGFSKWNWSCSFRHNCHNALLRKRCCTKSRWFFLFQKPLDWLSSGSLLSLHFQHHPCFSSSLPEDVTGHFNSRNGRLKSIRFTKIRYYFHSA